MSTLILQDASIAWLVVCVAVLLGISYRKAASDHSWLVCFLLLRVISGAIWIPLLFFRTALGFDVATAYRIYFLTVWIAAFGEAILAVLVIQATYREMMRPLEGLEKIGKIIFRWVAGVSVALSVALALAPHLSASGSLSTIAITQLAGQLQQGTSILTICLLLFVCFATRPLGLTFSSRIFGVALGLGVMATVDLVQAAWFAATGAHSLYSPIFLVSAVGNIIGEGIWLIYFLLPEPERKLVLLPTTSPFFFWNSISKALGDNPGYVAVAGFRPSMLADAEIKMMTAASRQEARNAAARVPSEPAAAEAVASMGPTPTWAAAR